MSAQTNENGVYPKDAAECIAWPGCKPYVYAEIFVLKVDGVWLGAKRYQLGGTDQRGGSGPLTKGHRIRQGGDHSDRRSCIADEARQLLRSMETSDCKLAPKIREWCQDLIDGPEPMDLFGAAS